MIKVNVVIVYHPVKDQVLMCHRQTEPYKGLYNFVGGKVHPKEDDFTAAYRELYEETGISKKNIDLSYLFKSYYYQDKLELQVFYGKMKNQQELIEEKHPLYWMDLNEDFSNPDRFAGLANIQHMILLIEQEKNRK